MNDTTKKFCQQHEIRILDTNKRAHRYHKVSMDYFKDPTDYNRFYQEIVADTEPLYTVEITESELERLAEFEAQVFNNLEKTGHYRMFEVLMEQKEEEKRLRHKHPAVQKAYEQYSLILKLAQSGEL